MSRKFQCKAIPSTWLENNGCRLDCGPYMSGAFEARMAIAALRNTKTPLSELTEGGMSGIFKGKMIKRIFVQDKDRGVPFLNTSDMLESDLTHVPRIPKKIADSDKACYLKPETILISAAGTIGRTIFAREDMSGLFACSDIMKVVPDANKIPAGYLHAFLSSDFGVPLVTAGTFGSIILHIEPSDLAGIQVPRFSREFENKVDALVKRASELRTSAVRLVDDARSRFDCFGKDVLTDNPIYPIVTTVSSKNLMTRLEAAYHDPSAETIENRITRGPHQLVSDLCSEVSLPGIFKRIYIDDPSHGAPYYTGGAIFWLEPVHKEILSRNTSLFNDVKICNGTILIQAFGQKGGLIGRVAWVGQFLDSSCTTHMLVRVIAKDESLSGYLFAYLSSDVGYAQIIRLPFGGSIPHFTEKQIANLPVPLLEQGDITEINENVLRAMSYRDEALELELRARQLISQAIEEGGR